MEPQSGEIRPEPVFYSGPDGIKLGESGCTAEKQFDLYDSHPAVQLVVVGWNEFTKNVVGQIVDADKPVAVITDYKPTVDLIHSLFDVKNVFVMFSDYQSPGCFEKLNINEALAVFINLNQDTETLVQLLNLKKRYPTTKYIVSLNNNQLKETFTAAGVTYCIAKEEVASKLVASYVFEPNVAALIDDLMSTTTKINDYDIKEYKITSDNPYCGTDCLQVFIDLKTKNNCVLLGINKSLNGADRTHKLRFPAGAGYGEVG